jgi:hypothetical protein
MPCKVKVDPMPQLGLIQVTRNGCGFCFNWAEPTQGVNPNEFGQLYYDIQIQNGLNSGFLSLMNLAGCSSKSLKCCIT